MKTAKKIRTGPLNDVAVVKEISNHLAAIVDLISESIDLTPEQEERACRLLALMVSNILKVVDSKRFNKLSQLIKGGFHE